MVGVEPVFGLLSAKNEKVHIEQMPRLHNVRRKTMWEETVQKKSEADETVPPSTSPQGRAFVLISKL